jgi:hypothetical protein
MLIIIYFERCLQLKVLQNFYLTVITYIVLNGVVFGYVKSIAVRIRTTCFIIQ